MDYEQKYKEALERAEKALEVFGTDKCEGARQIFSLFPELKESEDERIRKALICGMYALKEQHKTGFASIPIDNAIAWLEKQGEQKSIMNVPSREIILSIWDLGNEWKELTNCVISTEHGTQLDYIQKHWQESEYYLREKQREKTSTDKVESKFHEGEWIVSNNKKSTYQVIEVKRGIYVIRDNADNHEYHIGIEECEKSGRLWNISDAKDGDVLCYETKNEIRIFIYKNGHVHYHCCYYNGHLTTVDSFFVVEKYLLCYIHPATKEQRDTLIKAMADAGWEFDFDKKELKKISQRMVSAEAKEAMYDKSTNEEMKEALRTEYEKGRADAIAEMQVAWSEEDIRLQRKLIELIYSVSYCDERENLSNWLKSLKDRITWKPSEEQMKALDDFIYAKYPNIEKYGAAVKSLYQDLKNLKGE